jgi:hypothetical protein
MTSIKLKNTVPHDILESVYGTAFFYLRSSFKP